MGKGKKPAETKKKPSAAGAAKKRKGGAAESKEEKKAVAPRKSPRQLSKTWRAAKRLQKSSEPIFSLAAFRRTYTSMVAAVDEEEGPLQALTSAATGQLASVSISQDALRELQMNIEGILSTIVRSARFIEQAGRSRDPALPPRDTKPNKSQRKLGKSEGSYVDVQKKIGALTDEERRQLMKVQKARGNVVYRSNSTMLPRHFVAAATLYDKMGRLA